MGFDLYGLNPKLKGVQPSIDWATATDEDKDRYVKARNIFEQENPGHYFRNNVWWWRPLAYLIEDKCKDFLTEAQRKSLHYNDGKEYSDKVAVKIANRLQEVLDSGELEELKKRHDAEMQKAKEHNDILESKIKVIQDAHKGIAPKDYPKEEYTNWRALQEQKNWASSYPFDIDNVKEFILFARCSGGFSIC
ncbi:MAG TPA: hypothetical protein VLB82_03855 [Thermodesulfobacteriota bacterium]|nr:hypothetical protein [Thermodesulfobacteriota bacterium]